MRETRTPGGVQTRGRKHANTESSAWFGDQTREASLTTAQPKLYFDNTLKLSMTVLIQNIR